MKTKKLGRPIGSIRPIEERFWDMVEGPPDSDVCWVWKGSIRKGGYGRFRLTHTRETRAHQFAYELMEGPIPEGFEPDHLCRNPRCVNPAHIEIVTHEVNMFRSRGFHRRTYCQRGHPFDQVNTFVYRSGKRGCRTCAQLRRNKHGQN